MPESKTILLRGAIIRPRSPSKSAPKRVLVRLHFCFFFCWISPTAEYALPTLSNTSVSLRRRSSGSFTEAVAIPTSMKLDRNIVHRYINVSESFIESQRNLRTFNETVKLSLQLNCPLSPKCWGRKENNHNFCDTPWNSSSVQILRVWTWIWMHFYGSFQNSLWRYHRNRMSRLHRTANYLLDSNEVILTWHRRLEWSKLTVHILPFEVCGFMIRRSNSRSLTTANTPTASFQVFSEARSVTPEQEVLPSCNSSSQSDS